MLIQLDWGFIIRLYQSIYVLCKIVDMKYYVLSSYLDTVLHLEIVKLT